MLGQIVLGEGDKWRNISKREIRDLVHPNDILIYLENHKDEVEIVYHMGSISSTTETDADLIMAMNFTLSREIWKWCAVNNVRFIYASSYAVYGAGDSEIGFKDAEEPEQMAKLKPLNPYGWSKHSFDRRVSRVVHSEKRTEEVPPQWVGLRFFNIYGPNEYHKGEQMSVVSKLYPQVEAGAAARLFKSYHKDYQDGGQIRDFIWVGDCIDVLVWLYDHPEVSGIFNLGSGKGRSFKDLAAAVFGAVGKETKITYVDMPETLKPKYQYFTEADMSKLRQAGYTKEFTSLEEGVKKYVTEFLAKEDRYR